MADLSVRGVWQPQTEALFVVDTDAQSYASRSVNAVLASAERQKKCLQCRHIMLLFLHLYSRLMGSWHMRLDSSSIVLSPSFLPNGVSHTVRLWGG